MIGLSPLWGLDQLEGYQKGSDSTGSGTEVQVRLGAKAILQSTRRNGLLNPNNLRGEPESQGFLFQSFSVASTWGKSLSFDITGRSQWLFWNASTDWGTAGSSWYGGTEGTVFSVETWEIEYSHPDALFILGMGKIPWTPGPAKQLKGANYFEWLFGDYRKTLLWGGINFEWGAMRMVLGPRMDWVPESFSSTTTSVLPGESIVYGQAQFFLGPLDMGIFGAWDKDSTEGWWASYWLHQDVMVYTEGSYTTKAWIPRINDATCQIEMTRINGLRIMGGILYSPAIIDMSFYLEFLYNGDGYTAEEWELLGNRYDTFQNPMMLFPFLNCFRWNSMNLWYGALHIRPNGPLFGMVEWQYSIRYSLWYDVYSRLTVTWPFLKKLYLTLQWDVPWFLDTSAMGEPLFFPYEHRLEFSLFWMP
ncbi:MAG TPA: hypothetical protein PLW34_11735 [Termitinemataceae bacterium]|nr:hypothetical protein [Termitinemataceae bacterium]HOM23293.1 hypothetical protein [Termitinemataceae bacterium]HPQ00497.1 hypothetical protein [Termitinemataceae bacterium]